MVDKKLGLSLFLGVVLMGSIFLVVSLGNNVMTGNAFSWFRKDDSSSSRSLAPVVGDLRKSPIAKTSSATPVCGDSVCSVNAGENERSCYSDCARCVTRPFSAFFNNVGATEGELADGSQVCSQINRECIFIETIDNQAEFDLDTSVTPIGRVQDCSLPVTSYPSPRAFCCSFNPNFHGNRVY